MRLKVRHLSCYRYDEAVGFSPHKLYLRPRENALVRLHRYNLALFPEATLRWQQDMHDNPLALAFFEGTSKQLTILMEAEVQLEEANPFDFILSPHAVDYPFSYQKEEQEVLAPYLAPHPEGEQVNTWLNNLMPIRSGSTVDLLSAFNQALFQKLTYQRRDKEGIQTPDETIACQCGSCRDFAVLFMEGCRRLGLAARFVSGYLYDPPTRDGGPLYGRAAGAMHAWAQVYLPGAGWKGFDPTNGILCTQFFIPVAVSARAELANPIQGSYLSGHPVGNTMDFELDMQEIV